MGALKLNLLGSPRLTRDQGPVPIGRRKAMAMLAYLAVTGQPQQRETLLALLWPDYDPSGGRTNLRRDLSYLRQTLIEDVLISDRNEVYLDLSAGLWVDATHFRDLLMRAQAHDHGEGELCPTCLAALEEAVGLYGGELMAGFSLPDTPAFEEWLFFEREGLQQGLASVLQRLADHHGYRQEYDQAIAYSRRWLALDPLHEPAHRALMRLYAWSGQQAAALRQYEECARLLKKELNIAPAAETTALAESIKLRSLALPTDSGAARLDEETGRALAEATRLPTIGTLPRPIPRSNLPAQLTPFIGREEELAKLTELQARPDTRLVTITGAGGTGKTRLALALAELWQRTAFPDGVFFVSLAPISSAEYLISAMTQTLGVSFHDWADPREQLLRYLQDREALILLDNFEHLLVPDTGSDPEAVQLLLSLLHRASRVKWLVTSRERLNLQEEWVYELRGMRYPAESDLSQGKVGSERAHSAVMLFEQRARQARQSFNLAEEYPHVVRICQLVDGMPLGIELAAAWTRAMSCREIASEIERSLDFLRATTRNVPERHRSVRAVYHYSWQLLSEEEQGVLRKLSVFRGGFGREAAEHVAGASLSHLLSLADKSLLAQTTAGRYGMHELLRQFATEKLQEISAVHRATLMAHAAYYASFLQQREQDLRGKRQLEALEEIAAEIDNVRAGWQQAVSDGNIDLIGRSLAGMWHYDQIRGNFRESEARYRLALQNIITRGGSPDPAAATITARLLAQQGACKYSLGLFEEAEHLFSQAVFMLRQSQLEDKQVLAFALCVYGENFFLTDLTRAKELLLESRSLFTEAGDPWGAAWALHALANVAEGEANYPEAVNLYQESLVSFRLLGDQHRLADILNGLGRMAFVSGEYERAKLILEEGLRIRQRYGDKYGQAFSLLALGNLAGAMGQYERAVQELRQSMQIAREVGDPRLLSDALNGLGVIYRTAGAWQEAESAYRESLQLNAVREMPRLVAYSQYNLGCLAADRGEIAQAEQLLRDSLALWQTSGRAGELSAVHCQLGRVVSSRMDRLAEACDHLQEALRLARQIEAPPLALNAIVEVARLLASLPAMHGRREGTIALLALVHHHPASEAATRALAERILNTSFPGELPRQVQLDLWPTVESLLLELDNLARERSGSITLPDSVREASFPAAEHQPVGHSVSHNLPVQTTPFVGRKEELVALMELLVDPDVRLVTIVGPGGIGKTRLSLAAAGQQLETGRFPDGVYFVSLVPVDDPDGIPTAVAEAMRINFYGRDPVEQQLIRHLQDQRLLLVMDNFEHLAGGVGGLLGRLLAAIPGLKLLVTSRQRLNLSQEWGFDLGGLSYPEDGELGEPATVLDRYSGVNLLVQRLRQMDAGFHLTSENLPDVVRVCRLVEGMPLGLELAATWQPLMTLREIGDEIGRNLDFLTTHLQDVAERHRSLRAVFRHSWSLLTVEEQATFRRLSLFGAGFSREAALRVADTSLTVLGSLVRKSLLKRTKQERYEIHELLRQYAAEMLASNPAEKTAVQEAHMAYFASFMAQREAALNGSQQQIALEEIDSEIDHVFQAWRWAVEGADAEKLDQMMECLSEYIETRGRLRAGEEAYHQATARLRLSFGSQPTERQRLILGRLLVRWAWMAARIGSQIRSIDLMQEGMNLIRSVGSAGRSELYLPLGNMAEILYELGRANDAWAAALEALERSREMETAGADSWALNMLGHLAEFQGKYRQAEEYFRESIESYDEIGEVRGRAYAMNNWGRAAYAMGEYDLAQQLIGEALATRRQLDDQLGISYSLLDWGKLNLLRGQYQEAEGYIRGSLAIAERVGETDLVARGYHGLGWLDLARGQYGQATGYLRHSLAISREDSNRRSVPLALNGLAAAALAQGELEQARHYLEESLLVAREVGNLGDEARALRLMGDMAWDRGHTEEAARDYRQSLAIVSETGAAPTALEVIAGVARLYLAGNDHRRQTGVALLALILAHPATAGETREKARAIVEELPAELRQAISEGKAVPDLWQTVTELIQAL